jgi:hypothetical protein
MRRFGRLVNSRLRLTKSLHEEESGKSGKVDQAVKAKQEVHYFSSFSVSIKRA